MRDPRRATLAEKIKTKVTRLMGWELQKIVDAVIEVEDAAPVSLTMAEIGVVLLTVEQRIGAKTKAVVFDAFLEKFKIMKTGASE